MTNTPYKFKVAQSSANTTKGKQMSLSFPTGKNAYRIESMRVQIDDLDVIATTDYWKVQLSYKDLTGLALETIDQDDEIYTFGEEFTFAADNDEITTKVRTIGYKEIIGKLICKDEFYINCTTLGQDAAEEFHIEMEGQYVTISEDAKDKILKKTVI